MPQWLHSKHRSITHGISFTIINRKPMSKYQALHVSKHNKTDPAISLYKCCINISQVIANGFSLYIEPEKACKCKTLAYILLARATVRKNGYHNHEMKTFLPPPKAEGVLNVH